MSGVKCLGLLSICLLAADAWPGSLFDDDAVVELALTGPIGDLLVRRNKDEERPFSISLSGSSAPVEVRVRGKSRLRVCGFPPLRLNFRQGDARGTIFEGQDKLKLVTHCRDSDRGEQDLLEEYVAYRILNLLTDASFRVRLLRLHYRDADGGSSTPVTSRFGFVIEPAEQLAARIGAEPARLAGVPRQGYDVAHAAIVFVFQYLIANTDWGLVTADDAEFCCHNVKLFRPAAEAGGNIVIVPYDFDISGLVSTNYAKPDPTLRIKNVRQRAYRGLCVDRNELMHAIRIVNARKADILGLIDVVPGVTARNAKKTRRFLGAFFKQAADEKKLLERFERRCL